MLWCRLQVSLPEGFWARSFTLGHPTVRLEILDRLEVGGGRTLFRIRLPSDEGRDWGTDLRAIPEVHEVELVDKDEGSEIYQVVVSGRTFIPLFKRVRLVRNHPFPIQNGVATWTVVGPGGKVRALLTGLRASRIRYELRAVGQGPLGRLSSTLTSRQQEILRKSIAAGYFDVPRRISLTELAPRIGVASSTLSVTLAVVEKKILQSHA